MAEGEDGQAVGDEAVGDGGGGAAVSEEEPDEAPVLTPEQKKRQEEFRELFWKYLGKNLSPDCARRLQELLQGSPEARKKGEPEFQTTCGEEMQKHENDFQSKLQQGLSEKQILAAPKKPKASRPPPPPPKAKPWFVMPALPECGPDCLIGLQVAVIFFVPMIGLLLYGILYSQQQAPKKPAPSPTVAAPTGGKKSKGS